MTETRPWENVGCKRTTWWRMKRRAMKDGKLDEEAFAQAASDWRSRKANGVDHRKGASGRKPTLKGYQKPKLSSNGFDLDEVRRVLAEQDGSCYHAAEALGVSSPTLRAFVRRTPELKAEAEETLEIAVDKAMRVLMRAMDCDSIGVQVTAAKEFLRTEQARRRGFGPPAGGLEVRAPSAGVLTFRWLNEPLPPPIIDGDYEAESGTGT